MKMVDVGGKEKTERVAVATARLRMLPATLERILQGRVEKGDVLAAARLAGVMAAKRSAAPPVRARVGWPLRRLTTPRSRKNTPARKPVPSALDAASLAAKRLA